MRTDYHQDFIPDVVYHIYNRTVSGVNLFTYDEEYTTFMFKYDHYVGFFFETLAYCLIPNHFHYLVKIKPISEIDFSHFSDSKTSAYGPYRSQKITLNELIEDQFRRLFSSVALSYNHRHKRRGPLFDGRFNRVSAKYPSRILYLFCYIHHNPIHHGLTKRYELWKFSSYNTYVENLSKNSLGYGYICEIIKDVYKPDCLSVFKEMHKDFEIDPRDC